jgi:hypothetical protein
MLAHVFLRLLRLGSPSHAYERAFVRDIAVSTVEPRSRRVERLLVLGWVLIALKSLLTAWAVQRYGIPIRASWIILPTLAMGAACTWLYVRRA